MSSLRKLAVFLKPYWKLAIAGPLLMVIEVCMDLMQPRLLETIIDSGISDLNMNVILQTGLLMLVCAAFGLFGGVGNTFITVRASQSFSADLRSKLFRKIQTFSFGNLDNLDTGQLVTRLTNDVTQVGQLVLIMLRIMVRGPLLLIGSLILAVMTSPSLAVLFLVVIPLLSLTMVLVMRRAYPLFRGVQKRLDGVNTILQEFLSGVRVVKAFVRDEHEMDRFDNANNALKDQTISALRLLAIVLPLLTLTINLSLVTVLWFGGYQVVEGSLQAGQLVAFTNYLVRAISEMMMLAMLMVQISRAQASADRIVEVLDTTPEILNQASVLENEQPNGLVNFDHVTFSYDGEENAVLSDISFTARPGTTVAILGATGSGKSSLVHLIPRFYDVKDGKVTLDGIDVRDYDQEKLRKNIGIALQDATLFSGSIRDNIRYGRPEAPDEEVVAAAQAAQAHDFISALPNGYDTQLGQRGVNLSGGQKQRIAIARTLLLKPAVLILDDSTSAVDATTESKIQHALSEIMHDRTSFIIAQRISTVLDADQILVLDEGRLVAQGSHSELLASSPIYQEIFSSQLGAGLLATH